MKYLEEDLLLQDGIQAGGNVCPLTSLWCTGVPSVWWGRLFWLERGELLCLTWGGQKKAPDTGCWCASIFMKICSLSLERPLNLKGVVNYFVFSNTCLEPKDWLRSLVWRSFSENYDPSFWMTETIALKSRTSQLFNSASTLRQCHRHCNCLCKMGWGRGWIVLSHHRECLAPRHNVRCTGPSQRGSSSGWAFYPGQVALLLDQGRFLAHSWPGEKEQMQTLCIIHNIPTGQWASHILLYGCTAK